MLLSFLNIEFHRTINRLSDKLSSWFEFLILQIPNIGLSIIVFFLFVFLSKFLSKGLRRVARSVTNRRSLQSLMVRAGRLIIQLIGFFFALNIIGLDKAVTSLLAGAGILGLALSFAFQNIASNFISGILIATRHNYAIGDWVMTHTISGQVEEITIFHTIILTETGQYVTVPNKEILENPLYNYSKIGLREVEITVGISYTDDLEKVMAITRNALALVPCILQDKDMLLFYNKFDAYSINLEVNFWIKFERKRDHDTAVSDAIRAIKKAYDENNIVIPFPIRTLDFKKNLGKDIDTVNE